MKMRRPIVPIVMLLSLATALGTLWTESWLVAGTHEYDYILPTSAASAAIPEPVKPDLIAPTIADEKACDSLLNFPDYSTAVALSPEGHLLAVSAPGKGILVYHLP
jgi:hypothetical protein